jgi:hypothetical protein
MLHDKLMKKLEKKKGKGMSDVHREAKMSVVKQLRDDASESLLDKIKGLKKVSVMADSEEGLKEGLEKAEEIVGEMPEAKEVAEEESEDEEVPQIAMDEADMSHESKELEMMDDDQLEEMMAKIMELKKKRQA